MIPFNKPYAPDHISMSVAKKILKAPLGDETQHHLTVDALRVNHGILSDRQVVFTQSATQALEIMALCMDLNAHDEIIMPSFTYAATANAFARTGARIVFADIDPYTLNISSETVAPLITKHTRAIIPIHYGGISADLDGLIKLIKGSEIRLLEDAAHGIGANYKGKALGTIGSMGCLSFHHTKNITAGGSGGALIYESFWHERVQACLYQGTNRSAFLDGKVPVYHWEQLGGEFLMTYYHQLFLEKALPDLDWVTNRRLKISNDFFNFLTSDYIFDEHITFQKTVEGANGNGHIFPIILRDETLKRDLMTYLKANGIHAFTHYEPLHMSRAGRKYGDTRVSLESTERIGSRLLRLPLYATLTDSEVEKILEHLKLFLKGRC